MSIQSVSEIALFAGAIGFIGVTIWELVQVYKNNRKFSEDLQKHIDTIKNGGVPPPVD